MSWEAGRQRRAAAQTAMMKTDVKLQETAKARTVSTCIREPCSSSNTPSIMLSAPLLAMIYSEAPQPMLCHANEQQQTRLFFLLLSCSEVVIVFRVLSAHIHSTHRCQKKLKPLRLNLYSVYVRVRVVSPEANANKKHT